ncbi:uncharacterized protein LOC119741957 [Patiria miniata]|uniref:Uncharacterized protein n=1 Tax=Patiria miniata TaxID=46514 RepID=A0A914BCY0_PATMI|nr:uncharacterized protein LOC119741957 [Patiria miniata]
MTSKHWPLLLSLFSLGIILQNCFVNINLTSQSAQCLDRLRESVETGASLRARLNETEDLARRRQTLADETIIETARKKAEREQLLETLRLLREEQDKLKIQTGEVQMADQVVKKRKKYRENLDKYVAHLHKEKKSLMADIKKTKGLLKVIQDGETSGGTGGGVAGGNKKAEA